MLWLQCLKGASRLEVRRDRLVASWGSGYAGTRGAAYAGFVCTGGWWLHRLVRQ